MSPPRFPADNIDMVSQGLRGLLEREHVTAMVSSAACGADLIALREASRLGLRGRIVLPFDRALFRASSVTDRPGDWGPLFDRLVDAGAGRGDVVTLAQPAGDGAYAQANIAILDEAQALGRAANEPVCAVLVWDGVSRGPGDLTEEFGEAARGRGIPVLEVLTVKTCFVVQGFGEKTDLVSGRVLNLDASYEVIKEAAEAAGLRCVRADEIIHSGTIDQPMYEWLFRADLVIADLSTSNLNAVYELGVRYGLRPHTTIIVAENQFKNPFDVNHQITRAYEHLGKDIGRQEARRFATALASDIRTLMKQDSVDSPVYNFLALNPPVDRSRREESVSGGSAADVGSAQSPAAAQPAAAPAPQLDASAKALLDTARAALEKGNFLQAKSLLIALRTLLPRDAFIIQQLALATYKSQAPDAVTALIEAKGYLTELEPGTTNDPETIGLLGAIHKRMWDATKDRAQLDNAIAAYERGFYLKQDYYNGINFAYLLNLRAVLVYQAGDTAEATADFVLARRARREVMRYCDQALQGEALTTDARYWILATKWEAAVGLGDPALAETLRAEAEALPVAGWMLGTTREQIASLGELLARFSPGRA
jgi:hypothetical protein